MIVATSRLDIATHEGASLSDVTLEVNAFVRSSGVVSGLCILSTASGDSCLTLTASLDDDVVFAIDHKHAVGPSELCVQLQRGLALVVVRDARL